MSLIRNVLYNLLRFLHLGAHVMNMLHDALWCILVVFFLLKGGLFFCQDVPFITLFSYFSTGSDENLPHDHYLLSLMDDQGWVPISVIANFNRVHSL